MITHQTNTCQQNLDIADNKLMLPKTWPMRLGLQSTDGGI